MIAKSITFLDNHGTEVTLGAVGAGGTAAVLHFTGKAISPLAVAGGAVAGVAIGVAVKYWKQEEIVVAKGADLAEKVAKLAEAAAKKAAAASK